MQIHARGVELVVELLDAADQVESLSHAELRKLLRETAQTMGDLLARDHPNEVAAESDEN